VAQPAAERVDVWRSTWARSRWIRSASPRTWTGTSPTLCDQAVVDRGLREHGGTVSLLRAVPDGRSVRARAGAGRSDAGRGMACAYGGRPADGLSVACHPCRAALRSASEHPRPTRTLGGSACG
jgi:hypothetical protein